jgi:hypothetical protein
VETKRSSRGGNARDARTNRQGVCSLGFILASLLAIWLFQEVVVSTMQVHAREIPCSEFREMLKAGQIVAFTAGRPRITGVMMNPAATSERDTTRP